VALNMLDFLLLFILLIGSIWGLLRGPGKLLIGLFSLYVGLVISILLYRPLAGFFRDLLPGMSIRGSEALAFVFLLIVLVNGFSFFTRYFGTPPEERRRKKRGEVEEAVRKGGVRFLIGPLSYLAGLVIGFVVTVVWVSLILAIFQFGLRISGDAAGGTGTGLRYQIYTSALVPTFNYILFLIYKSVSWMPGGVPSIFAGLLGQFS
jgi:hypothetical protein